MKNIILIIITSILFLGCNPVEGQNKEIEVFSKKVIEIYNRKNSTKFNQLINKNTGLIFITTKGSNNSWEKVQNVCLKNKCEEKGFITIGIPYQSFLENYRAENLNKIEFTE
ncbi:hypothetical protein [Chryseobacterium luquanense]|uniref:Lipoprotein n=1 Tax=Chryseobacterium luquanense TaxID=2983766 RepID=A0ABT3Y4X5_9FLAO|nr:hypothetical protein [Chryseobacterium luquanense]MCX8533199.1 hypothetical protein [Chryseobacterium luquanense]